MKGNSRIRFGVVGYGAIGKRVAAAVALQDMAVAGVADILTDWRMRLATQAGFALFGATADHDTTLRRAGRAVGGDLGALLEQADVAVDCTPKRGRAGSERIVVRDDEHTFGARRTTGVPLPSRTRRLAASRGRGRE